MKNKIYIDEKLIVEIVKVEGKRHKKKILLEDGREIYPISSICKTSIKIKCFECDTVNKISSIQNGHLNKVYLCKSCGTTGERSPFFGKRHSTELKERLSRERKGKWGMGEKNAMYGKTVSDVWIEKYGTEKTEKLEEERSKKISEKISGEKNPFFGKKHPKSLIDEMVKKRKKTIEQYTESKKQEISKNLSLAQRKMKTQDEEKYIENKRRAARCSCKSHIKYKMNKVERAVFQELNNRNITMKYSVILGFFQFDFGDKENRILLEVQGDYWHSNPDIFGEGNKRSVINNLQVKNLLRDKEKYGFATSHGFKIFYIWENDIKNKNFTVLDEIAKILNK